MAAPPYTGAYGAPYYSAQPAPPPTAAPAQRSRGFRSAEHEKQFWAMKDLQAEKRRRNQQALDAVPALLKRIEDSERRSRRALDALAGRSRRPKTGKDADKKGKPGPRGKRAKKERSPSPSASEDEEPASDDEASDDAESGDDGDSASEEEDEAPRKRVARAGSTSKNDIARTVRREIQRAFSALAAGQPAAAAPGGDGAEAEEGGDAETALGAAGDAAGAAAPAARGGGELVREVRLPKGRHDAPLPNEPVQIERGARRMTRAELEPSAEDQGIEDPFEDLSDDGDGEDEAVGGAGGNSDAARAKRLERLAEDEDERQRAAAASVPRPLPPGRRPGYAGVTDVSYDAKGKATKTTVDEPLSADEIERRRRGFSFQTGVAALGRAPGTLFAEPAQPQWLKSLLALPAAQAGGR